LFTRQPEKTFREPACLHHMATDDMYLENLEEWIFEDNRIVRLNVTKLTLQVTYHALSNDLQVPVDVAKECVIS